MHKIIHAIILWTSFLVLGCDDSVGDQQDAPESAKTADSDCAQLTGWELHACLRSRIDTIEKKSQLLEKIPELAADKSVGAPARLYRCEGRSTGKLEGYVARPDLVLECSNGRCDVKFGDTRFEAQATSQGTLDAFGPVYFEFDPVEGRAQGVTGAPFYYFTGKCIESEPATNPKESSREEPWEGSFYPNESTLLEDFPYGSFANASECLEAGLRLKTANDGQGRFECGYNCDCRPSAIKGMSDFCVCEETVGSQGTWWDGEFPAE